MNKTIIGVLSVALLIAFAPFIYADVTETSDSGATTLTTIGIGGQDPLINASAHSGNISVLNIDSNSETTHWAGFIGNVSGTVGLSGGQNNKLFEFQIGNAAIDAIAATADVNFNWGLLQVVDNTTVDAALNVGTDAPDSTTQGWTNSSATWLTVSGGATITLFDHQQNQNETWTTTVLADSASPSNESLDDLAWIGNATVVNDGNEFMSFNNDRTVEYQLIAGLNNTDGSSSEQVIYHFWIVDNE